MSQERVNPFSDPICEDEIPQLQNLETRDIAKSKARGFVSEHPSWKPSQSTRSRISHYLKPTLQDDGNTNSEWETVAPDEDVILRPSIYLRQRLENGRRAYPTHNALGRDRQAAEHTQHRTTALMPTSSSRNLARTLTMHTSNRPKRASQPPRALSVYEDDSVFPKITDQNQQQGRQPEPSRTLTKNRPATLGYDRNAHGELVASYSKSSSRASNDPFKFDGAGYSMFLQPSAEREVSRALYGAGNFPVIKRANLSPSTNEHPLSELAQLVNKTAAEKDAGSDWQTITTEQTPHGALELTLRLDQDVGSSLADVSDGPEYESFDHFLGATAGSQHSRETHLEGNVYSNATQRRTLSRGISQPTYRNSRVASARPVATVRHLSRLSTDASNRPKLSSKLSQMRKPMMSYSSLDSEPEQDNFDTTTPVSPDTVVEVVTPRHSKWSSPRRRQDSRDIVGLGTQDGDMIYKSRDFAPRNTSADHNFPSLPFPLISLQEAALRQSHGITRGEADYTTAGSMCDAKARSGTISTISSYGPKTPTTPVGDIPDASGIPRPPRAYHRHSPARALRQLNSSAIIDTHSGSFFRNSLPTNTSLLSARFFRLSGFSARTTRERRDGPNHTSRTHPEHGLLTPSETDLIHSAREDILCRRRRCPEEDAQQRRVFLVIFVMAVFFPPIGVLALYGKFDATIAWYGKGERGCLTQEQRSTLKQQLWVEGVLYIGLIISLVVYYSVHG
ncbi:hypothetical protein MAC_07412 [Metarhizium acridum CQMa 102]|uniref:Uncharacterized protein n=1 Tax=Metarhizium acridum (strain CQMa 102) TaxID=655827 RepID=E9EC14_METAQ|nr:uncharacterized protein MAC_07412 [Metarhizium acridum CQMa 102]EFY86550.1 hypothetical protein MAC_07412 [Metarhizium acridum CQMa 102]